MSSLQAISHVVMASSAVVIVFHTSTVIVASDTSTKYSCCSISSCR